MNTSSDSAENGPAPLDDAPVVPIILVVTAFILWAITPADGWWIFSRKSVIIGVMSLGISLSAIVYRYSGPVMRRGVGFVTLLVHAKRRNLAHRRHNPRQQSLSRACVSRGVSWTRHVRQTTTDGWTTARRWLRSSEGSSTDQQPEQPSAQSDDVTHTTDE